MAAAQLAAGVTLATSAKSGFRMRKRRPTHDPHTSSRGACRFDDWKYEMTPEELRESRRKLGLFQWELYDMAKFGRASGRSAQKVHVSRMENGKRPISEAQAQRVRALLKMKGLDDE